MYVRRNSIYLDILLNNQQILTKKQCSNKFIFIHFVLYGQRIVHILAKKSKQ